MLTQHSSARHFARLHSEERLIHNEPLSPPPIPAVLTPCAVQTSRSRLRRLTLWYTAALALHNKAHPHTALWRHSPRTTELTQLRNYAEIDRHRHATLEVCSSRCLRLRRLIQNPAIMASTATRGQPTAAARTAPGGRALPRTPSLASCPPPSCAASSDTLTYPSSCTACALNALAGCILHTQ